ncbi:hypothetical protein V492_02940 [Pseudogymnoascus sp. VKM F-4246]|nr:hypothetical protein V492_02940 [Pseudogymnoascus sp. VKM F-4246]
MMAMILEAHRHVAVKIFTNDGQDTDEIAIYKHISQGNKSRLGYRYVRTALDSFELMNRAHLTELISILGPPPPELIKRDERSAEWFDGNGKWLEPDENEPERLPLLPSSGLKSAEENLNGKDKELFLNFIKSMLQWEPEKRKTARDLLNVPWLTRSQV